MITVGYKIYLKTLRFSADSEINLRNNQNNPKVFPRCADKTYIRGEEPPWNNHRKDNEMEKKFIGELIGQFKIFVSDSMEDGIHKDFDDHEDFLRAALETFFDSQDD